MTCRGCGNDIDDAAPFCPLCAADPLLGERWTDTLGFGEERAPEIPHDGDIGECTVEELVLPVLWCASALQAAECAGVDVLGRAQGLNWLTKRLRGGKIGEEYEGIVSFMENYAQQLQWLGGEVLERCQQEMSREEFEARYPQLAWACLHEYACYLDMHSSAEAGDVFSRRLYHRLARLGAVAPASWSPEDGEYRVAFNGLLLSPFPGDGAAHMPGMENIESGPDCLEGTLEVALTPAVWRRWADLTLSPAAMVFVYVQSNPLGESAWGEDGPSAGLLEAVRWQAERLEQKHGVHVSWDTLEVAGLPAACCDLTHPWDDGLLVQRYVWVYGPQHVYFLRGHAPAEAPEYVQAVAAAIDGFEVAA